MTPPRPFYKRKRWIAAGAIWLLIAYPLSLGPVAFFAMMDWLPPWLSTTVTIAYQPLDNLGDSGLGAPITYWVGLWMDLARWTASS